jgi:hypothetical protein
MVSSSSSYCWASVANSPNVLQPYWLRRFSSHHLSSLRDHSGKIIDLSYYFFLNVPTFANSRLRETLAVKGGTTWATNSRWVFPENARLPRKFRDILHDVNLRHGTDGFTSPPKKGVLKIFFSPWIIWRFRFGLKPSSWVPKASTLPLDHRSRKS